MEQLDGIEMNLDCKLYKWEIIDRVVRLQYNGPMNIRFNHSPLKGETIDGICRWYYKGSMDRYFDIRN